MLKQKTFNEIDVQEQSCERLFVESALHEELILNSIEDLRMVNSKIFDEQTKAIASKERLETVIETLDELLKENKNKISQLELILNPHK